VNLESGIWNLRSATRGRWAPLALADKSTQARRDAGANLVASTLLDTRAYLAGLVEVP
jgi:hypothetical protein